VKKIIIFFIFIILSLYLITDEIVFPEEYSYGDNISQKIDLYRGKSDKVLVWIHGGGWLFGNKRAERWINRFENHFVDNKDHNVFMIGYRIGRNTAPNAVEDVLCAYNKILEISFSEGFSTDDVIVAGASAGGHLALLIGLYDQRNVSLCKINNKPKAVINLFGITDIKKTSDYLDAEKFFTASNYVKTWILPDKDLEKISLNYSPINMTVIKAPNFLTIHGTKDSWVPYNQAVLLDTKLQENHKLLTIDNGRHYRFSESQNELIRTEIKKFIDINYN